LSAWIWLSLGLGAALGDSGADVLTKRYFSHLRPYGMAMARLLAAVPFLALAALFVSLPPLTHPFWLIVASMLPLEVIAYLLYMRALKTCHLSLCVPFLAFTPVFLLGTGYLLLGEGLNRWGIGGIIMVAAGSYVLGLGADGGGRTGLLSPVKALARESGARLMLLVAAIYSCSAALFKLAVLHSGPSFFAVYYLLTFIGLMSVPLPLSRVRLRPAIRKRYGWWLALGLCASLSSLAFAFGVELAPAAYLVAVKRLSIFLSVLLGGLWLQERPLLPRFAGVVLMCSGVACIALRG